MKHLSEYRMLMEAGLEYSTSICGKSLKKMLNEYGLLMINGDCYLHILELYLYIFDDCLLS